MAYDPQVIRAAQERLEQRRSDADTRAAALRAKLTAQDPTLREIEVQVAEALPQITRVILDGGDAAALHAVQQRNLALQRQLADRLHALGYSENNFEPQYTCPKCRDTGYADGRMCDCYRRLLQEEACKRLSSLSAMKLTSFDEMDPTLYDGTPDPKLGVSPRQRMLDIIAYCRSYAQQFTPQADSLLLQGATGTGKTHLALAIARTVTEQGYGVVYGSMQPLLRRMESEHFGRAEGDSTAQLTACDLLVLDDLGMEFDSPFYRACIYTLINDRLLSGRPTVISTNLGFGAIKERYGEQIASRILGGFQPLMCTGRDIRLLLRQRAMR